MILNYPANSGLPVKWPLKRCMCVFYTLTFKLAISHNQQAYCPVREMCTVSLSLGSVSRRCSRLHECTPCWSIPSASPCRRQAKIERAQIVLDRSQPGLPGSSSSASPVFGRTPNAGLKSSGMVLIGICTTEMTEEGQAPSTDSFRQEWASGCPVRDRTTS